MRTKGERMIVNSASCAKLSNWVMIIKNYDDDNGDDDYLVHITTMKGVTYSINLEVTQGKHETKEDMFSSTSRLDQRT